MQPSRKPLSSGQDLGKAYRGLPKHLHFLLLLESFSVADFSIRNSRFEICLCRLLAGGYWTSFLTNQASIMLLQRGNTYHGKPIVL